MTQTVLMNNVNYIYSSTKCVIQNIVQKFTRKKLREVIDTAITDEILKQFINMLATISTVKKYIYI